MLEKSKAFTGKENFFDATMLFANEKETIYKDTCCHYNAKGNEMFADYIMQKILAQTQNSQLKPASN